MATRYQGVRWAMDERAKRKRRWRLRSRTRRRKGGDGMEDEMDGMEDGGWRMVNEESYVLYIVLGGCGMECGVCSV